MTSITKSLSFNNISIGQCVWLLDTLTNQGTIAQIDDMVFLRSGSLISNQAATYPTAFEKFAYKGHSWGTTSLTTGGSSMFSMRFFNGLYLITAANGKVFTSSDNLSWDERLTGTSSTLRDIAFRNGTYVVVGDGGTVRTSTDTSAWTARTSNTSNQLNKIIVAHNLFIAIGNSGTIITSPDGINWTTRTSGTASNLNDIASESGNTVAVGASGTIITSSNGTSWTTRTSGITGTLNGIAIDRGVYVAAGAGGTVVRATNLSQWSASHVGAAAGETKMTTFDGGFMIADGSSPAFTSPDGISWTNRPLAPTGTINSVSYLNGELFILTTSTTSFRRSFETIGIRQFQHFGDQVLHMRIK